MKGFVCAFMIALTSFSGLAYADAMCPPPLVTNALFLKDNVNSKVKLDASLDDSSGNFTDLLTRITKRFGGPPPYPVDQIVVYEVSNPLLKGVKGYTFSTHLNGCVIRWYQISDDFYLELMGKSS